MEAHGVDSTEERHHISKTYGRTVSRSASRQGPRSSLCSIGMEPPSSRWSSAMARIACATQPEEWTQAALARRRRSARSGSGQHLL